MFKNVCVLDTFLRIYFINSYTICMVIYKTHVPTYEIFEKIENNCKK